MATTSLAGLALYERGLSYWSAVLDRRRIEQLEPTLREATTLIHLDLQISVCFSYTLDNLCRLQLVLVNNGYLAPEIALYNMKSSQQSLLQG